jgi:hypothetical protein
MLFVLRRLTLTTGRRDQVLNLTRADHSGMETDMSGVGSPVEANTGNMWLCPQHLFDGISTAGAMKAIEFKDCVVLCV